MKAPPWGSWNRERYACLRSRRNEKIDYGDSQRSLLIREPLLKRRTARFLSAALRRAGVIGGKSITAFRVDSRVQNPVTVTKHGDTRLRDSYGCKRSGT